MTIHKAGCNQALATVDETGMPYQRTVLLKYFDDVDWLSNSDYVAP